MQFFIKIFLNGYSFGVCQQLSLDTLLINVGRIKITDIYFISAKAKSIGPSHLVLYSIFQ